MRDAMKLMGAGDLNAATAAIQSALRNLPVPDRPGVAPGLARGDFVDAEYRVVADAPASGVADVERASGVPPGQEMHSGTFTSAYGARDYLAYAPSSRPWQPSPLLLMLHGCTQNAADFARGTRMHLRAAEEGYVVLYPVQSARNNANGCWNWFRSADQQRSLGEPALLAGLVDEMADRFGCDRGRVYVAGLSAGGAMAVTLGHVYPDVFRAVGVHSGLPHGCAHDVPTALAAMRKGGATASPNASASTAGAFVPTIVFHGDSDRTVNVRNAMRVVADARGKSAHGAAGEDGPWVETVTKGRVAGGHDFTITRARDSAGKLRVETWIVHGAGHGWFGGAPGAPLPIPRGPDATAEMLRFFRGIG